MNQILLHLPHSSTVFPEDYWKNRFLLPKKEVDRFNEIITDRLTGELFQSSEYPAVIFPYSRVFCDVEKYADDEKEPMSRWGMGMLYTHTHEKKRFFVPPEGYRQRLLEEVYLPYHRQLRDVTNGLLRRGNVVLVDCHSYSEEIQMERNEAMPLPDICIGVNEDSSYSKELTDLAVRFFRERGYSVEVNAPYSGAMLPEGIEEGENHLWCIMLEIHKRVYLKENRKSENFEVLKQQLAHLIQFLERDQKLIGETKG